jgi:peptidoglycan/LPS O-acetylase OafA/YrhL
VEQDAESLVPTVSVLDAEPVAAAATEPRSDVTRPKDDGGPFHIPSLDGIRAVSFTTVFLGHAGLGKYVPGYFGLNLFFFLSGFLITTLLRMEYAKTQTISFSGFYIRRAFRILPPFYLVLVVASIATAMGLMRNTLTVTALAFQFGHLTNYYVVLNGWWTGMAPGTWVYWSLAVEEHFYLAFPLFYLWLSRKVPRGDRQAMVMLAISAAVLVWRCVLIYGYHVAKERTYVATDARIDSILAGCILAVWRNPVVDRIGFSDRALGYVWLPLGALSILVSLVIRGFTFEQTFRYTLQSFGLLPFFVAAMRWPERWPFRALNYAWIRRIGVLSYSMYLMHTSLLWAFEIWLPWPTAMRSITAYVLLIALGSLIHGCIEIPLGKLRRQWSLGMAKAHAGSAVGGH